MPISDNVSMFFDAKPAIFEKAAVLRKNMTPAEKLLWDILKDRNLFSYKFRRQHPIDIFIVDFYCHPLRLAIELDGKYHLRKEQKEYDIGRAGELQNWGLKVIRFTNEEVTENIEGVIKKTKTVIKFREADMNQYK